VVVVVLVVEGLVVVEVDKELDGGVREKLVVKVSVVKISEKEVSGNCMMMILCICKKRIYSILF